jgi:hypothetical protein
MDRMEGSDQNEVEIVRRHSVCGEGWGKRLLP